MGRLWRDLYEKVMRNRRIILLVQLQLRKTLEVAEMPLYSSHIFFFGCVSFFFPSFFLFFSVVYIFFFSPLQRLLFCPLLYFVFLFILFFFFCCLSVLLLSLFDKRCSPKRTVTLDEAVVEMEDEEEEKKNRKWTRRCLCEKYGEMLLNGDSWLPSQFINNDKHLKSLLYSVPLALMFTGLFSDHRCFSLLTISTGYLQRHHLRNFYNKKDIRVKCNFGFDACMIFVTASVW